MDGGMEAATEPEQSRADPEAPDSLDDLDGPWDVNDIAPGVASLRGGWACSVVATAFFALVSAAIVAGLVFILVLKTARSPSDDHALSMAVLLPESEDQPGSSEATTARESGTERKTRHFHPWMGVRGDTGWDEHDKPRSFETNMSVIEYLRRYGSFQRRTDDMDDSV